MTCQVELEDNLLWNFTTRGRKAGHQQSYFCHKGRLGWMIFAAAGRSLQLTTHAAAIVSRSSLFAVAWPAHNLLALKQPSNRGPSVQFLHSAAARLAYSGDDETSEA